MPFRLLVLSALAASLAASSSAQEDRLSRRDLTTETNRLSADVSDLESRTAQLQIQNADLALKVRDLETDNAQLTGRVETLQFQLGQAREEASRMQADDAEIGSRLEELDSKIASLEAVIAQQNSLFFDGTLPGPGEGGLTAADGTDLNLPGAGGLASGAAASEPVAGSLGTISASDLPGEAGPLFADAKARLLRFDYAGAERSFRAFLDRFGDDPQAGEAQYWLGEVLYQQQNYAESGAAYTDMIREFPDDARAPDALVKLGRSLRLIGESERACDVLATLPARYPDASPVTRNLANVERDRSGCTS